MSTFFRVFTRPRDDVLGLYDTYDGHAFISRLTVADIPHALRWVAAERLVGHLPPNRARLVDGIMRATAEHLTSRPTRSAVKALLVDMANTEAGVDTKDLYVHFDSRIDELRAIFVEAVRESHDPQALIERSFWRSRAWMSSLGWQLEQFVTATRKAESDAWLWLIERTPASSQAEVRRTRALAKTRQELAAAANAKFVVPRRKVPEQQVDRSSPSYAAVYAESADAELQRRLEQALAHTATSFPARIDAVELVSAARRADGTFWHKLPNSLKTRVNELLAGVIGLGT